MTVDHSGADAAPSTAATRHVLVVEDDDGVARLVERWVRNFYGESATVHVEQTVADSKARLESLPSLDVAIVDRKLPDGTGKDVLAAMTGQFDPITLIITGSSPESEIIKLPINDYVIKPLDEETLFKQLSLLEKLQAANALQEYSDARKASLLEYHLDDPEGNPLFRRFAAKWSYDYLEVAHFGDQVLVYELYVGDATDDVEDGDTHVSIAGSLDPSVRQLLDAGELEPMGELVPSSDGYGWMEAEGRDLIDTGEGSIGIYRFTADTPEQYISPLDSDADSASCVELTDILENEFN